MEVYDEKECDFYGYIRKLKSPSWATIFLITAYTQRYLHPFRPCLDENGIRVIMSCGYFNLHHKKSLLKELDRLAALMSSMACYNTTH